MFKRKIVLTALCCFLLLGLVPSGCRRAANKARESRIEKKSAATDTEVKEKETEAATPQDQAVQDLDNAQEDIEQAIGEVETEIKEIEKIDTGQDSENDI